MLKQRAAVQVAKGDSMLLVVVIYRSSVADLSTSIEILKTLLCLLCDIFTESLWTIIKVARYLMAVK